MVKCKICSEEMYGLVCDNEWCNQQYVECSCCEKVLMLSEAYEYRGAIACDSCFEEVSENRERQRQEIIEEESLKTSCFAGLDMNPETAVGKANREILKSQREIAGKESSRLRLYEGRD